MCYVILLLISFLGSILADDSVQLIGNYAGQKITSSTLIWASADNGRVPEYAVVGGTEQIPGKIE